jgi:PhnB protein
LSERSPDEPEPTPVLRQGKIHANTSKMAKRPERYRNAVVPHIYVDGASDGIAFYEKAFGAVELFRIAHPNGKILHAELEICDSLGILAIQTTGSMASRSPSAAAPPVCTSSSMITKPYCDVPSSRARRRSSRLRKCFYGANSASVRDPFGHVWVLLSWKEDLATVEMERRGNAVLSR